MGVIARLYREANRAEDKAERLRAKGGLRRIQKARRLEEKVAMNREILHNWDEERWG